MIQVIYFGVHSSSRRRKKTKIEKKIEEAAGREEDNWRSSEEESQNKNVMKKTFTHNSEETPRKVKSASSTMRKETPGKEKTLKRLKSKNKTPAKP